jgi:hypothetical protein
MDTNRESGKRGNDGRENHPQPHYDSKLQPFYELYRQGITEANRGWFEILRRVSGRYVVPVGAVWALYEIAGEFLNSGNNNLDDRSFFGVLLVAGMLLTIAIVSLRRIEDTDVEQKENRKEGKVESAEPGAGGKSPGQNRRTSTRDRSTDVDGGSE